MVKGLHNILSTVKTAFPTAAQTARKAKYMAQGPIITSNPITSQTSSLTTKVQAKLEQLQTFRKETTLLKIDGVEREVTHFIGSGTKKDAGWVFDPLTGGLGYAKFAGEAQMRSEKLASELYQLTGAKTPKISLAVERIPAKNVYSHDTESIGIISNYLPTESIKPEDVKLLREDFAADCWLANWDALKSGNVGMHNGKAVRMDVGGSLCYRARGERKGLAFGEEVNELTSFFDNYSLSKRYLLDMSREELLASLKKVATINDDDVIKIIDANAYKMGYRHYYDTARKQMTYGIAKINDGIKNPEYIKEVLIARKKYIAEFLKKCESSPQKKGESIEAYIRRIVGEMPKTKYKLPYEKLTLSSRVGQEVSGLTMAETLTPSQKRFYDEAFEVFEVSSKRQISHPNAGDTLTSDCMVHAMNESSLEAVLKDGFTSKELRPLSKEGTGMDTLTTLSGDFWDVEAPISIKDYFRRAKCAEGETKFLYHTKYHTNGCDLTVVVNKNAVDSRLIQKSFLAPEVGSTILAKDGIAQPNATYTTHRVVPYGVPANAIDRVILRADEPEKIQSIIKKIEASGLDIKLYDTDGKLLWQPVKKATDIMSKYKFNLYGRQGIPLKYSREQFRNDVWNLIAREVPVDQRTEFLARFHLTAGSNGVLDGAPVIKGFQPRTNTERKMLSLIEKFYQNETDITGNSEAKKVLDRILKIHPEFAMMIGKPQHGTHIYSIDIHTLELFKKALNNPSYACLSAEGKKVLQHAAIMHDYGKMGHIKSPGHAKLSRAYAEKVLSSNDNIPQDVKNRILNLIENHHWFEAYNKGHMSPDEFAKIFPTWEDRVIAMILAKADFETVNPTFHLKRLIDGRTLTQEQFEKSFDAMMKGLIKSCPNP
ncbi:hypothetical protein IJO12_09485 [bacterium]|nr:hypothetical protein [bacterium]